MTNREFIVFVKMFGGNGSGLETISTIHFNAALRGSCCEEKEENHQKKFNYNSHIAIKTNDYGWIEKRIFRGIIN